MRRLLALGAAAVTLTVVIAFLVPLLAAVRVIAADRATSAAQLESQSLAAVLSTVNDAPTVERIVAEQNARSANAASVFLPTGQVVGDATPGGDAVELARRGRAFTVSAGGARAVLVPVRGPDGATAVVRVTVPRSVLREGVSRASILLVCLGLALILVAVLLADRLALAIVGPMDRLAGTASRLEQGQLDARVRPEGPGEVATVGHALNLLAERIDDLLAAEREAAADLSHGLRTPLTVLRLDADALEDPGERERLASDVDELEAAVTRIISEARRPRPSAGPTPPTCDLAEEVRNLGAFWSTLADAQQRRCTIDIRVDRAVVAVPRADVAAAFEALAGNVFTHTPAGTPFRVSVAPAGAGRVALVVDDDGPGFPAGWRPDRGRSGRGSTGLGLDIARAVAERAGGTLRTGRADGGGARVELELPLAPAPAGPVTPTSVAADGDAAD